MAKRINFNAQPLEIRLAAHCIGMDYKKPYSRQNGRFYKPYRNYFTTHDAAADCPLWLDMVNRGHAKIARKTAEESGFSYCFRLTDAGLDWLGNALNVQILNREEIERSAPEGTLPEGV